jgi:hypothetical protein
MKISELVYHLELLKQQHGDVDCVILDEETGFRSLIEDHHVHFNEGAVEFRDNDEKEIYEPDAARARKLRSPDS